MSFRSLNFNIRILYTGRTHELSDHDKKKTSNRSSIPSGIDTMKHVKLAAFIADSNLSHRSIPVLKRRKTILQCKPYPIDFPLVRRLSNKNSFPIKKQHQQQQKTKNFIQLIVSWRTHHKIPGQQKKKVCERERERWRRRNHFQGCSKLL